LNTAYFIENTIVKYFFLRAKHCSKTHGYVFQFLVIREQYPWDLLRKRKRKLRGEACHPNVHWEYLHFSWKGPG